jgi:hypothetical protein
MLFWRLSVLGCTVLCAGVLAACGGGSGSGAVAPSTAQSAAPAAAGQTSGTKIQVTIRRGAAAHKNTATSASSAQNVGAIARRSPQYVSTNTRGLQITVQSGTSSQSVYADLSSGSPLCTTSGNISTCTIAVPTLGAQETFTAFETDTTPSNEASSGYGTGFASNTNILAAISQAKDLTSQLGGAITIGLNLGPVVSFFFDCTPDDSVPTPLPQPSSPNFGIDETGFSNNGDQITNSRLVVTQGMAVNGALLPQFCDAADGFQDFAPSPAPFVDANASPVPIALAANSPTIGLAPIVNNGTPPPANAYAQSVSIPDDSYYWFNLYFVVGVNVAASYPATASNTIVVKNNLTAVNPFMGQTVNATSPTNGVLTYYVTAIAASPLTLSAAVNTNTSTVVGTDEGAASGMATESGYNLGDSACKTTGGTTLAILTSVAPINPTTWQQSFDVVAGATAGTCTVFLFDNKAKTMTQPITVTVQ